MHLKLNKFKSASVWSASIVTHPIIGEVMQLTEIEYVPVISTIEHQAHDEEVTFQAWEQLYSAADMVRVGSVFILDNTGAPAGLLKTLVIAAIEKRSLMLVSKNVINARAFVEKNTTAIWFDKNYYATTPAMNFVIRQQASQATYFSKLTNGN